jgi:hypothetical protein
MMKIAGIITDWSRSQFSQFFSWVKKNYTDTFIEKIEKYLNRFNSYVVPIAALILLISGVVFAIKLSEVTIFFIALAGVFLVFFADYISEKFHEACGAAISANPTTLSSNAYLHLVGYLNIFFSIGLAIAAIYYGIKESSLENFFYFILFSIFIFISNVPVINTDLINLKIDDKSSIATDLIGLFSLTAKSPLYLSSILARIVTIVGSIYVIFMTVKMLAASEIEVFGLLPDSGAAVGILFAGLFYPVIAYFIFMIIFFFADIVLSVLQIKNIGRNDK